MTPPRLIFVSESAPVGADPRLVPHKGRIYSVVLGITYAEYMRHERLKLLPAANHWSRPRARAAAAALLDSHLSGVFLLLGGRVRDAFDIKARIFDVVRDGERTFVTLPWPGASNVMWHEPTCVPRCRAAVLEAAPGVVLGVR